MHILKLLMAILSFFCISEIHAISVHTFDSMSLSALESSKDSAILRTEADIAYLNPNNIVVNDEGIFLTTDNHVLFKLLSIGTNEMGLYTQVLEKNSELATVWPVIQCKSCGNWFAKTFFNKGECPVCHTMN